MHRVKKNDGDDTKFGSKKVIKMFTSIIPKMYRYVGGGRYTAPIEHSF